jgi:hypothetical protein
MSFAARFALYQDRGCAPLGRIPVQQSTNIQQGVLMSKKHADRGTFDQEHRLFLPAWEVFKQNKYHDLEKWIGELRRPLTGYW